MFLCALLIFIAPSATSSLAGGLAHENNDQLSITSKVFSYDGEVAVVVATTTTDKGSYNGVGIADSFLRISTVLQSLQYTEFNV